MIKFDKSTHLMILFTFVIIFIVLYLYYTINDVKYISNELKKMTNDIQKIKLDLQSMSVSISNINLLGMVGGNSQNHTSQNLQMQPSQIKMTEIKQTTETPKVNILDDEDDEDDATSVNTDELKKIITETDDTLEESQIEESQSSPKLGDSEEDKLRKLKYEDIKDLCKKQNITSKGTKAQLIEKLLSKQ